MSGKHNKKSIPTFVGNDEIYCRFYICSLCNYEGIIEEHTYCPNCGINLAWENEEK